MNNIHRVTSRVLVNADVLTQRTTFDWLLRLREKNEGAFQLHTTRAVAEQALSTPAALRSRVAWAQMRDRLAKSMAALDEVVPDDDAKNPGGRGVVRSAARATAADVVLTDDSGTALEADMFEDEFDVISPDDFFVLITESNQESLSAVVDEQVAYWRGRGPDRGESAVQLDDSLREAGCPKFAARVLWALQLRRRQRLGQFGRFAFGAGREWSGPHGF